jgi:hypothetical protein
MFGNAEQAAYGAAKAGLVGLINVLSLEGRAHGVLCNALLPTAESRMGAQMPPAQLEKFGELFQSAGDLLGNSNSASFVSPLAVFLVSEACRSTHGMYSASLGRYARVFVAAGAGWVGPRKAPPTVDDIAAHFDDIGNPASLTFPESLSDEFTDVIRQLKKT